MWNIRTSKLLRLFRYGRAAEIEHDVDLFDMETGLFTKGEGDSIAPLNIRGKEELE